MNISTHCRWLFIASTLFLASCASVQSYDDYDYTAFLEAEPRSILVRPPVNNSVDVEAPYTYISTITKPLAEKGYYVFPVAVIDHFLKENGLPTPAEMNAVPLDKIKEHIGADAVLYVTINEWGQKYQVLSSVTTVNADMKLVEVETGALLWEGQAKAQQSSDDGGGDIFVALASAVIEQVAKSISDHTPGLARLANTNAVNDGSRGLPDGPYKLLADEINNEAN